MKLNVLVVLAAFRINSATQCLAQCPTSSDTSPTLSFVSMALTDSWQVATYRKRERERPYRVSIIDSTNYLYIARLPSRLGWNFVVYQNIDSQWLFISELRKANPRESRRPREWWNSSLIFPFHFSCSFLSFLLVQSIASSRSWGRARIWLKSPYASHCTTVPIIRTSAGISRNKKQTAS